MKERSRKNSGKLWDSWKEGVRKEWRKKFLEENNEEKAKEKREDGERKQRKKRHKDHKEKGENVKVRSR